RRGEPVTEDKLRELDAQGWELYHVDEDFSENKNVAAENRARLIEMIALWYVEAGKYNVLPIDSRVQMRMSDERPQLSKDRRRYVFYPGTPVVSSAIAPQILNRPHSRTAAIDSQKGPEGELPAPGGRSAR